MPGIVGLITKMPPQRAEQELGRMVSSVRHEPFYETGTWTDERLGVYVGWTARTGSLPGALPLRDQTGDVVLVFSGEEFSAPETLQQSSGSGPADGTQGSPNLLELYKEGANFPASLNGRFQGLLTDRVRGTSTLFNDRYGMHRIYFHESQEAFYFAAEAKAILAVRPELRNLDLVSLGEFITCGCVLENRTLFNGISVLPSASAWVFQNSAVPQKRTYFDPRQWEEQDAVVPDLYYQEFRDVFSHILPRYFNGQQEIGMSLTGGLDTRMIMAWRKSAPESLPCYSFGSMFHENQDVRIGRSVAEVCHQDHQVIPVGNEFLTDFARWAERAVYLTDGCVGVNRASDLYVNAQARNIAPVRMTGNYGGEVMRRVRAFKPVAPFPDLFCPELLPHIRQASTTYGGVIQGHPLSFALFRQAPWHHYGLLALEETQLSLRTPYLDNDLVKTIYRAPQSACANSDICLRLIADGDATLARIRTDRGLGGNGNALAALLLRNYLEFTFKAEYAYDYGMPQWVSRTDHAVGGLHLERLFLGKHKFAHYRFWYREALSQYVQDILLDERTLSRPCFQRKTVEKLVHGHLREGQNYTLEIHALLTIELVHRLFLERQ